MAGRHSMTTINFSEYSDDELLQSLQSIDRESYPDNFRRLISELKKRRDQKPVEPEAPVHDSDDTYPLIPDKPSRKTGVITLVSIAIVIVAVLMVSNRPVVQQGNGCRAGCRDRTGPGTGG